jgi:PAS domain-containing protein
MSAGAAAARLVHKPESQEDIAFASGTQQEAAAAAVANLSQIAMDAVKKVDALNDDAEKRGLKRKSFDTGGYKTDLEGEKLKTDMADAGVAEPDSATSSSATGGKKKKLDEGKREERNAREKERSFRISKQINELRGLLSSGGVIVPKGTKSSVLTEAANYIRMLQQHQYRSEIDRHQLVQQVQRIGSGAIGPQAAQAVRHVAAQNGVWSLGNFGGVPPKSAMTTIYHPNGGAPQADETQSNGSSNGPLSNKVEEADYRHVFNSCTIGMAIASMGGAFIDCNKFFCQISNYTKQEICSQTIFNLTARQDLQSAFDLISQMLSAPLDPTVTNTSCVLRGALRERPDIGLSVKLIKASDGVAKCFCVTLIQNPTSAFDNSKPIPATITVQGQVDYDTKDPSRQALDQAPAYTAG